MLKTLRISHFKSIHGADLKFGKANLFIGPNGAGKSNVLEALGILAAAVSRGLEPTELDERGIRLSNPTMFKSAFKNTHIPQAFRLEAGFEHGRYECSIRAGLGKSALEFHSEALYDGSDKVFGRGPNGINTNLKSAGNPEIKSRLVDGSRGLWSILSPFASISDEFRRELDDLSGYSIYAPQTAVMRGLAVDARLKEPLGLTGSGLASAFIESHRQALSSKSIDHRKYIQKILSVIWQPGWTDMIKVDVFNPAIVPSHIKSDGQLLYMRDQFMKTNRNYLSAFDASEGTLYLIFVASLLAHEAAPHTFALDNVDGTLNPKLVRKLADTIVDVCCNPPPNSDAQKQVFVTSHHPSSLDSFDLFNEDQAVFVAHRDLQSDAARGSTTFNRIRPPNGLSKSEWLDRSAGKNLSTLVLEGLIPDAL